jgi:hypothetical protein
MQSNFDLNQSVTVTPNLLDAYFGYDFVSDDRSMTAMVALEQALASLQDALAMGELESYGIHALACLQAVMVAMLQSGGVE